MEPQGRTLPPVQQVRSVSGASGGRGVQQGWAGVAWGTHATAAYLGPTLRDLLAVAAADGDIEVVASDIPIGLPGQWPPAGGGTCPEGSRPRWQSVFMTPVRHVLLAGDRLSAVLVIQQLAGQGVSAQAYGLRTKIFELDAWIQDCAHTAIEVHPEPCVAAMAGWPVPTRKKTWAGAEQRRRLLEAAGIRLPSELDLVGEMAAVDAAPDAAVVAWTACGHAHAQARSIPQDPQVFSDGIRCAIWA